MKLITHNMLTSKGLKGVVVGYPLKINARDIKLLDLEFNKEFVSRMISRLDWNCFVNAAKEVGHDGNLPEKLDGYHEDNENFLKEVHHALLEVDIVEGELICPETNRKFPISEGIPNMLIKEDEL